MAKDVENTWKTLDARSYPQREFMLLKVSSYDCSVIYDGDYGANRLIHSESKNMKVYT
jgi:hypothetical protein